MDKSKSDTTPKVATPKVAVKRRTGAVESKSSAMRSKAKPSAPKVKGASSDHKVVGQATLKMPGGKTYALPVYEGTCGPHVVDVRSLVNENIFTFDPGFMATASCTSKITFIDGLKGELLYRGYPIEQLVTRYSFLDTAYLLMIGELPRPDESASFAHRIRYHTMVSERLVDFIRGFDSTAHPMAMLITLIGAQSAFYHEVINVDSPESRDTACYQLIAKLPSLTALSYKYSIGQPLMPPQNRLGFVENFLYMMFGTPCEDYVVDPIVVKALECIMILHADHEQNASTSAVRLTGSTFANPFACISAGVASLWGPAHGGANEAVLAMLQDIGTPANVPKYLKEIRSGNSDKRLMGFGHRVYKNFDPRANVMRSVCHNIIDHLKLDDPLFDTALALEKIALKDPYYVKRNLYPNIDFYSGIVLRAIGIPSQMFTAIFAIARTVGWVSQWRELQDDPELKIGRPRQLYEGSAPRSL